VSSEPRRLPAISLAGCRRIVIIGITGSGKTTLATRLARHLRAPRVELDELHWGPNWTPAPPEHFRAAADAATAHHRWVADGNYRAVRDLVWPRADTLIWLDYPLIVNLWRLTRRNIARIATGAELYHGNRESFRTHFLSRDSLYLWALQSHRRRPQDWTDLFAGRDYPHLAILRLRSPKATRRWLARVTRPSH
jgi:adenylate kinase family enzyme